MNRAQLADANKIARTRLTCVKQVKNLNNLLDNPKTKTDEIDRKLQELALNVSALCQQQIELKEQLEPTRPIVETDTIFTARPGYPMDY